MGEEVVSDDKSGKRRAIGQNDEMDRIYDYLTQHETPLELVDRFSATRVATDSEKNDRNVRKNKRGRVKYTEAERVKKMEAFKRQEIKHMIATSMDRGVNVKACKSTHVFFLNIP
jgi:late competence protein required for DNA uptake (superfamily II DNA/RNA helicase)